MTLADQLSAGVDALGLEIGAEAQEKLVAYLALLAKWNRVYNLTALRNPSEWVTHHLLDSLSVLPFVRGPVIADVGSGAGLPGLALAIARPQWQVVSIEAVDKKAAFQRQVVAELGLENVRIEGRRVEEVALGAAANTVISRAFAGLNAFVELTRHLLAADGRWVAMKGRLPQDELACLPEDVHVVTLEQLAVPDLRAERCVIVLEKNRET